MNVVYWDGLSTAPPQLKSHVLTIGNFDGVHRGHRALIRRLLHLKKQLQRPAMAITFDPPPTAILRPHLLAEPLATLQQRVADIAALGTDRILVLQASRALLEVSANAFFKELLLEQLELKGIVEGRNFCFGKDRQGTITQLQHWCHKEQLPCEVVDDVYRRRMRISSSTIREAIKRGDVEAARLGLGRPYSVTGKIVHGDHRGRTIGFPTCNLAEIATLVPATGVYAAEAVLGDRLFAGAVNIGPNPTFSIDARKVEAHLLGLAEEVYDQSLTLRFLSRLRDTTRFSSVLELQKQLDSDLKQTEQVYHDYIRRQPARPNR
ncbi:MAG: riboflavin biosynthesis protein RibF [Gemmatales bacterium]